MSRISKSRKEQIIRSIISTTFADRKQALLKQSQVVGIKILNKQFKKHKEALDSLSPKFKKDMMTEVENINLSLPDLIPVKGKAKESSIADPEIKAAHESYLKESTYSYIYYAYTGQPQTINILLSKSGVYAKNYRVIYAVTTKPDDYFVIKYAAEVTKLNNDMIGLAKSLIEVWGNLNTAKQVHDYNPDWDVYFEPNAKVNPTGKGLIISADQIKKQIACSAANTCSKAA